MKRQSQNKSLSKPDNISLSGSKAPSEGSSQEITVERVELRKSIGFVGAVALLVSNTGGTGIFIVPTTLLRYAGSPLMSLIMWFVGGVIQATLAFSVAELAVSFKKAGGPYYYTYQTFGSLAAFVFMWGFVAFIAAPAWAIGSYTTSLYLLSLIYKDCMVPDMIVKLVASWIMVTLVVINCTYMKFVARIQAFLTSTKVLAFLIIIICGFMLLPSENGQENLEAMTDGTNTDLASIALSLFAGFYGYGGWQIITILAEEVKDPEKVIPRALGVSFLFLIVACVATNFAYFVVLTKEDALKSDAIAVLFGQMIHPAVAVTLGVLICLCSIGGLNVCIMGQPRLVYAAGLNGHMPRMMTLLHTEFKTPWPASMFLCLLGLGTLWSGTVMSMVDTLSLYAVFMTFNMMICFLFLRWKKPDMPRPLKMPIVFPIFCAILNALLMVLTVIAKPKQLGFVVLYVLGGVPVYFLCVKWQRPKAVFSYIDKFSIHLQKLLCLSYPET